VEMKINKVGIEMSNEDENETRFGGIYIGNNQSETLASKEISTEMFSNK